jgi:hypothetical protein
MNSLLLRRLDDLSEDELWDIVMGHQQPRLMRQAAMERWLFPADYGYMWANERLQRLKEQLGRAHSSPH